MQEVSPPNSSFSTSNGKRPAEHPYSDRALFLQRLFLIRDLLFNRLHSLGHIIAEIIVLLVAADDLTVRAKENDTGNTLNAIDFCRDTLGIDNVLPRKFVRLYAFESVLRLIPDRNTDDFKTFWTILLVKILDDGCLTYARTCLLYTSDAADD